MKPDWLSFEWFTSEVLQGYHWLNPFYLYFIPAIPLIFILKWVFGSRRQRVFSINIPPQNSSEFEWISLLRFISPIFMGLSLSLFLIALARPQRSLALEESWKEGLNIILALDVSESMNATDLPPSRLHVAREVAKKFISERKYDKIGLVIFSGESYTVCPLTSDYALLLSYLEMINSDLIQTSGTAIGEALAMSINRLRDANGQSKVIVLLSDGDNTAGSLSPQTATELAKSFDVRVYTVGLGINSAMEYDEEMLKSVSANSRGQYFTASSNSELQEVFDKIDRLEKNKLESQILTQFSDYYYVYLNWGIVLFLIGFLVKVSPLGNIFED